MTLQEAAGVLLARYREYGEVETYIASPKGMVLKLFIGLNRGGFKTIGYDIVNKAGYAGLALYFVTESLELGEDVIDGNWEFCNKDGVTIAALAASKSDNNVIAFRKRP